MLLPANASDPASMVAQAVNIFKHASKASVQLKEESSKKKEKTTQTENDDNQQEEEPLSDKPPEAKPKFTLQTKK